MTDPVPKPAPESFPAGDGGQRSKRAHWLRVWRAFRPFAARHRAPFWKAAAAALVVVGARLAFPWPLKHLLGPWLRGAEPAAAFDDPGQVLTMGLVFFGVVLVLGAAEFLQRLQVAHFSIAWVRDIRAEAFLAAHRVDPRALDLDPGDLVARLIGDTARLKAGLKGFLTHVATNGLLFLGVTAILLWVDPLLGAITAAAAALVLLVTWFGANRVYNRYLKLRKKEGKLASRIQAALEDEPEAGDFARVNYSSGEHEASVVRLQGETTMTVHVVLGLATLASIWAGLSGLRSGRVGAEELFLFLVYFVSLHRPAVRLSRQGTRIGKMMACGHRLERLLAAARKSDAGAAPLPPLRDCLKLKRLVLDGERGEGGRPRLGPLDLVVPAGQKVALCGAAGAGRSSLLRLLAGALKRSDGKILWDGTKLHRLPVGAIATQVAFASEEPRWLRRTVRELLGLPPGPVPADAARILEECGLGELIRGLPRGLDSRLGPDEVSHREARRLDLARVLLGTHSLALLEDPYAAFPTTTPPAAWQALLGDPGRTVLASLADGAPLAGFDRILVLERGTITADRLLGEPGARTLGGAA